MIRETQKLNVFYEEIKIGELSRDNDLVYSFCYDDGWLNFSDKFQLSIAMPFQKEPFGNRISLSFFENLLPEGEVREILGKNYHIESPFEFLKEFGKDCAGAVIISAEDKSPFRPSEKEVDDVVQIEMSQIYKAIEEKQSVAEVISDMNPGYLSLAGAQDKFPAIFKDGKFYLPENAGPTTHIVKVPIQRSGVKESVYNEYYCMCLARAVGLNVPDCFILDEGRYPLYVIERYDRVEDNSGKVYRIHQQDFCQAQGIISERKYEEKGGPTIKDNYQLIMKNVWIKKRTSHTFLFLDWICFNLLIGNNDSHSKNLSLLLKEDKNELSPFYDLLCTAIYPSLKRQFSFLVGDRTDASRIGKTQLDSVDELLGLKKGTMRERMLLMKNKLMEHKDNVAKELKRLHPKSRIAARISELIEKRCKSLERQGVV